MCDYQKLSAAGGNLLGSIFVCTRENKMGVANSQSLAAFDILLNGLVCARYFFVFFALHKKRKSKGVKRSSLVEVSEQLNEYDFWKS